MVTGACSLFKTDFAIASTGYADTGNGTIPAGTIWIAWGSAGDVRTYCLTEDNGREANTRNAAEIALLRMRDYLTDFFS